MTVRAFGLEATIRTVHDGDTLYGDIDQGIGVWNKGLSKSGMGLRLYGCSAAELRMPGGPEAQANLEALIPVGSVVPIVCMDWDKWAGRIDVRIDLPGLGDLAAHLIDGGWAVPWNGRGPAPYPPWPRTP